MNEKASGIEIGFIDKERSDFNLAGDPIPYYAIKLTPEQVKIVEHTELDFLRIDGRTLFSVKDKEGNLTGEYMLFVLFRK